MSRPHALPPHRERAFAATWADPMLTTRQVGERFGMCRDSAHRTGKRLGLAPRAEIRAAAGLARYGPRKPPQPKRERTVRATVRPAFYRCPYCGGVSSDPEGHSLCLTRRAA